MAMSVFYLAVLFSFLVPTNVQAQVSCRDLNKILDYELNSYNAIKGVWDAESEVWASKFTLPRATYCTINYNGEDLPNNFYCAFRPSTEREASQVAKQLVQEIESCFAGKFGRVRSDPKSTTESSLVLTHSYGRKTFSLPRESVEISVSVGYSVYKRRQDLKYFIHFFVNSR